MNPGHMNTVLLVEDDPSLRRAVRTSLRVRDFDVLETASGQDALVLVVDRRPDIVLLDLGLPGIDGLEVLRRLRVFSDLPVIVLTARDRQSDKVGALDAGADDYITKPFDPDELIARIRAALRRAPNAQAVNAIVTVGDLTIDLARRQVRRGEELVHLTKIELALLEQLVTNPGKLLTREYLLAKVWGSGYRTETNYLRVFVGQLRRKLGDAAAQPRLILTEPGIGYRWIA
jgi:two-component system KDP operon response regulator KdpE